jgi:NADH-quinone oxidoreductase subunit G
LAQLRKRLAAASPVFSAIDGIVPAQWGAFGKEGALEPKPFAYPISDFYRTDAVSRASPTMAQCAAVHEAAAADPQKTGTHG